MSKAFTKEDQNGDDEELQEKRAKEDAAFKALGSKKNYITPAGFAKLKNEFHALLDEERPKLVQVVSWAAGNGDRSENGDYLYGKKRLREIDRRLRFLTKRMEIAEVIDPAQVKATKVQFGATVTYENESGVKKTISIVGIDEIDPAQGKVSWISPLARVLLNAEAGDAVTFLSPKGEEELEVLKVEYRGIG